MSISEELPVKAGKGKCFEATGQISAQSRCAGLRNSVIAYSTGPSSHPHPSGRNILRFSMAGRVGVEGRCRYADLPEEVLGAPFCFAFCATANPWRSSSASGSGGWTRGLAGGRHWVRTSDLSGVSKVDLPRVLELRRRCVRGRTQVIGGSGLHLVTQITSLTPCATLAYNGVWCKPFVTADDLWWGPDGTWA